jgi:hypothetical protein
MPAGVTDEGFRRMMRPQASITVDQDAPAATRTHDALIASPHGASIHGFSPSTICSAWRLLILVTLYPVHERQRVFVAMIFSQYCRHVVTAIYEFDKP